MTAWRVGAAKGQPWWRFYTRPVFLVLAGVSMVEAVGLWKPVRFGFVVTALLCVYLIFRGPYPFRTRLGRTAAGLARVGCVSVPYTVFTWFAHPPLSLQGLRPICDGTDFADPNLEGCMTSENSAAWNHELVVACMAGLVVAEAVIALVGWRRSRRTVLRPPGAI
jgi:hypothetical protein